ncbi:hypothetical protein BGZ65_011715, partial [Modicella reniformis]
MNYKDIDGTGGAAKDMNQDGMVQPPPPSYTASASDPLSANKHYGPHNTGAQQETIYEAQPVDGASYQQQYTTYPPPAGGYGSPGVGYGPAPGSYVPPAGGGSVVFVVEDIDDNRVRRRGIPMAMIFFILG